MAEALVVQFLLDNLNQLLKEAKLQNEVKDNVTKLETDLKMLKAFVADAEKIPKELLTQVVKEMVKTIRLNAYDAEDAIDLYVVHNAIQKSRGRISRMWHGVEYATKIHDVAKQVNDVRAEAQEIQVKMPPAVKLLGDADGNNSMEKMAPAVEKQDVVGFDEEANKVIKRLIRGTKDLQVISIVGMGGLGKTTLAQKIYTDPDVKQEFSILAWSYVSQTYKRREVLLDILGGVYPLLMPEIRSMTDAELVKKVENDLTYKYLVVVDDVWTTEDWENLKVPFPDNKNGSRILLTSRHKEPALAANPDVNSPPHDLKFLTKDESWELLRRKVFGTQGTCPPHLEPIGKEIALNCKGLPLAIVVLAGMLRGKADQIWEDVKSDVKQFFMESRDKLVEGVLDRSYNQLPHHLKACFLYLGIFPEDFEIPVWQLIRLWIAEGFVANFGRVCLERRAVGILHELVGRNLVLTSTRSLMGEIKTCRIHDMLRQLCLTKAKEENFYTNESKSDTDNFRRLCIHSAIMDYIAKKPSGKLVRSFLCFNSSEENKELSRDYVQYLPQGFPLLRVFDVHRISFPIFPSKLIQLILVRYLAISGKFIILPEAISGLRNLQTLIVKPTGPTIDIKVDVWNMSHLRHIHTSDASMSLIDKEGPPVGNNDLQTLTCLSPESCTQNVFSRISNIRKLGIRGKLSIRVAKGKGWSESFNLAKLDNLEKLKLVNVVSSSPSYDGKLHVVSSGPSYDGKLPGLPKFPPNLKKLTLQNTNLDWSCMSVLAMLPKLNVLKLKDYAFEGKEWTLSCESKGFAEIRVLHIGKTNLVKWVATDLHFPNLERLIIKECKSLEAIPPTLGKVRTLQMIELYHASPYAVASAKKIQKNSTQGIQVDIYPSENKTAS